MNTVSEVTNERFRVNVMLISHAVCAHLLLFHKTQSAYLLAAEASPSTSDVTVSSQATIWLHV